MTFYIGLFGSIAAIMLASLIGKLVAWGGFGTAIERNTKFLATFAAGVFGIIALSLLRESFHITENMFLTALGVVGGALLIEILMHLIPNAHHHHNIPDCAHKHSCLDARRMLLSDAIHNIGDGLVLVPAFLINVHIGITAAVGILLHEVVQELSEFFVLRQAGYSVRRALMLNFLVSSTILLGVAIALLLTSIGSFEGILLALSAGGFIMILVRDLIPHTFHAIRASGHTHIHVVMFLLGALLMIGSMLLISHP